MLRWSRLNDGWLKCLGSDERTLMVTTGIPCEAGLSVPIKNSSCQAFTQSLRVYIRLHTARGSTQKPPQLSHQSPSEGDTIRGMMNDCVCTPLPVSSQDPHRGVRPNKARSLGLNLPAPLRSSQLRQTRHEAISIQGPRD